MNAMQSELAPPGSGLPADCPEWAEVVAGAYDLERREILADGFRAEVFRCRGRLRSSEFSSAPYLTDGGVQVGERFSPEAAAVASRRFEPSGAGATPPASRGRRSSGSSTVGFGFESGR